MIPLLVARRAQRRLTRTTLASAAIAGAVLLTGPVGQLTHLLPHWGNPFTAHTTDRSHPPLMMSLRDLADFHAATATFQVVVDVEHGTTHVPALLAGQRTTFLGVGSVDATVDFTHLTGDNVHVAGHDVTITLPAPRLAPAVIDPHASRVLGRDRGLLDRVTGAVSDTPTDDAELYQRADAQLNTAAATSDLIARAQANTRNSLAQLLGPLGYTHVTVNFTSGAE